jgi:hypothetical protein
VTLASAAAVEAARLRNNPSAAQRERNQPRFAAVQLPSADRSRRSDLEMQPLVNGAFTLVHGRQPDLPIVEDANVTWVPYISTVVKAPTEENVIATVFYPADLKARDGGGVQFKLGGDAKTPVVSYTLNGKTVKYTLGEKAVRSAE